jgi:hypothetical protein
MKEEKEYFNHLCVYEGGGYSGCIWQDNYFLVDKEGTFYNFFTSGYKGIKGESEITGLWTQNADHPKSPTWVNLDNQDEIDHACKHFGLSTIYGIIAGYNENWADNLECPFYIACETCGDRVHSIESMFMTGYRGVGGIATEPTGYVCEDCHYTCEQCGEYTPIEELCSFQDQNYCEYCLEKIKE